MPEPASGSHFERLFAVLRDAPERAKPASEPTSTAPVLVDAVSVSHATAKAQPDPTRAALSALKLSSWLTFTHVAATSPYASDPAPRDPGTTSRVIYPLRGAATGPVLELLART